MSKGYGQYCTHLLKQVSIGVYYKAQYRDLIIKDPIMVFHVTCDCLFSLHLTALVSCGRQL